MRRLLAIVGLLASGCTTLGPMPAATGVSAVPAARPEGELGFSAAPASYLSSGAVADPKGAAVPQVTALFDPDRLILPGLILAARGVASGGAGGFVEPMLGYRRALTDRFAGAVVVYGTHASGAQNGARFDADRYGAELDADVRVTGASRWAELHVAWGVALTGVSGNGRYCVDERGYCVDCGAMPAATVDAVGSGAYVTGNAALVVDLFRHRESWFHGGRVAFGVAGGTMPTWRNGVQGDAATYATLGLHVSWAVGAER